MTAWAAERPQGYGRRLAGAVAGRLSLCFFAERDRWALWLPVLFGAGIALFFALPASPPWWAGPVVAAAALASGWALAARPGGLLLAAALVAAAAGFTAADLRTRAVAAPVLAERLGPVAVTGRILDARLHDGGIRLLLDGLAIDGLAAEATPQRVRLVLRGQGQELQAGTTVRLRAVLLPPPGPPLPGGYDFARMAWFERIGAVGFVLGAPQPVEDAAPDDMRSAFVARFAAWRRAVADRVLSALPGQAGAVAAALMSGERGAISDEVNAAMRDSGLAHLLSISGLHLGLLAGVVFLAVRCGLAAIELLALHWPIKKLAAATALVAAFFYLMLSGAQVPTQRAFLMTGVVLVAVMVDRTALSMRVVVLAGLLVLLAAPESLLSVSFQMSFAAVVALIATYEAAGPHLARWRAHAGFGRVALLYVGGVLLTSLVGSLATAPFAADQFNRVALYSLLANLVAVPVTALWIMPLVVAAFVAMPLGLEQWPLLAMGWGLEAVLWSAAATARLPGAVELLPSLGPFYLPATVLGGLWLCLWRGRWRFLGVLGLAAGIAAALLAPPPPDLLVDGAQRRLALRQADGSYAMVEGRGSGAAAQQWLRAAGETAYAPGRDVAGCDANGCFMARAGRRVAVVRRTAALAEDCRLADLVIRLDAGWRGCRNGTPTLARADLVRDGVHAVRLAPDGVAVETVRQRLGARPWVAPPPAWTIRQAPVRTLQ